MLGYFGLLGLLRVHTLIGDYHGALAALSPLNLFRTEFLFTPKIAGQGRGHGFAQ
jgi:RNA polymerase I-associated factor PAF67